uniref:Uncharacterized protein n=1 Tax=Arundo donax TaxID=35708 RepID=A0A0A9FKM9_ARUDO
MVGAGGADAAQDAVCGGLGGDEGAAEVGIYHVVPLAAAERRVMARVGGKRGRRRGRRRLPLSAHLDRVGEAGDLGAYPQAQALAKFVVDDCTEKEKSMLRTEQA